MLHSTTLTVAEHGTATTPRRKKKQEPCWTLTRERSSFFIGEGEGLCLSKPVTLAQEVGTTSGWVLLGCPQDCDVENMVGKNLQEFGLTLGVHRAWVLSLTTPKVLHMGLLLETIWRLQLWAKLSSNHSSPLLSSPPGNTLTGYVDECATTMLTMCKGEEKDHGNPGGGEPLGWGPGWNVGTPAVLAAPGLARESGTAAAPSSCRSYPYHPHQVACFSGPVPTQWM